MIKPLALSMLLASSAAFSAVIPKPIAGDSRVQRVHYDPNEVFEIKTEIGKSTLIQLADDESIQGEAAGLGMGDAEAWALTVRGNNIFLKPSADLPDTNMLIVTNKRTYAFNLSTSLSTPTGYVVRFSYPEDLNNPVSQRRADLVEQKLNKAFNDALVITGGDPDKAKALIETQLLNFNFYLKGDDEIKPTSVWSDDNFTYFQFRNNRQLPVVFSLNSKGDEGVTNTHVRDDILIVQDVQERFMLRLGEYSVAVFNADYSQRPTPYNHLGSTRLGEVRTETGEAE